MALIIRQRMALRKTFEFNCHSTKPLSLKKVYVESMIAWFYNIFLD